MNSSYSVACLVQNNFKSFNFKSRAFELKPWLVPALSKQIEASCEMLTEATFRFFASSVKHPQKNSSAQNFILISAQNPLCHILQKKIFFLFRDFFGATRKVLNLKRQSWSGSDKLPHAWGMENMPLDKVVRF